MRADEIELAVELEIAYLNSHRSIISERTITDRIMASGARILVTHPISPGSTVQVCTPETKFQASSVVKDVQSNGSIWRAVIEFTGTDWKRHWIFPRDPQEELCEELLDHSKRTFQALQLIQSQLSNGDRLDLRLLAQVKLDIDELRRSIFNVQRSLS